MALNSPDGFPPLSAKGAASPSPNLSYSNIVSTPRPGNAFSLSPSPSLDDQLDFSETHVQAARDEWGLSLVGYSIGRRPYYESLLAAIRKAWKLKGTMKLLSLSDGFFMLKFTSPEDFDMALSGGVWFFLGKPFVLQKWVPNFKPVREESSSIPIWFKILDLPLPCWTPEGISRIASKIGIPIAVDNLTAEKSRLTYARVCVQVTKSCVYPESIPISILGEPFVLKIQYEWKPVPCEHCSSIVHTPEFCPSKPQVPPSSAQSARGRSTSRKPPRPNNRTSSSQRQNNLTDAALITSRSDNPQNLASASTIHPPAIDIPPPHSNTEHQATSIPNLNSPTEESNPVEIVVPTTLKVKVASPNKFELLQDYLNDQSTPATSLHSEEQACQKSSYKLKVPMILPHIAAWNVRGFNSPDKVRACTDLVRRCNLAFLAVLENRIHENSFLDPWFQNNHLVFENEESCHNFHLSKSGRIWIKWDSSLVQFKPTHITTQMISGELHKGDDFICTLSVIYASNSQSERFKLWDSLREVGSSISSPWALLGDFNCCCQPSEKSGGSTLLQSQLWDFKSLIFDLGLLDLASTGLKFTWFNQSATDPIHLKLDRMLINDKWLEHYPNSYYEVHPPNCSDHSPIILLPGNLNKKQHRFLFKNFWTKQDSFWNELLNIFAQPVYGNPILGLYSKLKYLKCVIKGMSWANSSTLSSRIACLRNQQAICLEMLNTEPQNSFLNSQLKNLNSDLLDCSSSWNNWLYQRAKLKWLSHGEDDLKFLYAKLRMRKHYNSLLSNTEPLLRPNLISTIISHFEELFNASPSAPNMDISSIPTGLPISLKKLNMADVKPLILNISEKLAGWKARLLSLAGRFQFLKFTVWNTIAYWIRGAVLPKACFKIINRLCAKFLFFGNSEAKKLHLIAWKRTCKPKHLGGLGLPNLHSLYFAYTCSQIFRFYNFKSILSSYLNAIYGTPWTPTLHKESPYWKDVKKAASQISSNVLFYFNSHSKLAMLWDPWIDGKSLSMVCLDRNILSFFPHNAKVSDFLDGGAWNLPGLGGNALASFLGSNAYDTDATNNITWKDKSKATLSTFINQFFCEDSVLEWHKLVWHKHHALKYSIYTWIALNNGLKTADELIKRNIVVNNDCPLCYSQSESANHILFECDYSFTVLSKLIPYLGEFLLRPRLMQVLLFLGERPFILNKQREFYLLIVCCTTYYLWRERNDRRFSSNFKSTSTLCSLIKSAVVAKTSKWKNVEDLIVSWPA
ncbi:hypothetical protein M5K25_015257 [Dendrobium thyrsiflorum]|uniref:Reverse transcriptase zinc-binding domain-containing protein n=1 Tax=Dendrobium thyrsiflorum TaxID=117978 RepID=A0ABD0UWX0_DENTH